MTVQKVDLNASEALYAFGAWLTTREKSLRLGKHYDAAPVAELVAAFCIVNGLPEVREDFSKKNIMVPADA